MVLGPLRARPGRHESRCLAAARREPGRTAAGGDPDGRARRRCATRARPTPGAGGGRRPRRAPALRGPDARLLHAGRASCPASAAGARLRRAGDRPRAGAARARRDRRRRRLRRAVRAAPPARARAERAGVRAGRRRRRHLVLEPLSRRALRHRVAGLLVLVLRGARAGMGVDRALSGRAGDPALPRTTSPTASSCAATSSWTPASRRRATTSAARRWHVTTEDGARYSATYCVMASGCLSTPHRPAIEGLDDFAATGTTPRAGRADGVELAGKRVGVIGTGSTGIQLIPQLAKQAEHLYVFQRTAELQHARAQPAARPRRAARGQGRVPRAAPARPRVAQRRAGLASRTRCRSARRSRSTPEERAARLRARLGEGGIGGVTAGVQRHQRRTPRRTTRPPTSCAARSARSSATRRPPRRCARRRTRSAPSASASTPTTTRPTTATTSRSSTSAATRSCGSPPRGIETASAEYELDVIVFATGFDAMTGALLDIDIRGRDGRHAAATSGRTGRAPTSGSRPPASRTCSS